MLLSCAHRAVRHSRALATRTISTTCAPRGDMTKVEEADGVATLLLAKPPVNSLNLEFMTELAEQLKALEADRAVKAVVLASSYPRIFSAGLDITEMYKPDPVRLGSFWRSFQTMFSTLYGLAKPVVAAIDGNAPAGGCLLAVASDYRIMGDGNFKIGLNETQLGIAAPQWFADAFVATVGQRQAERMMQQGTLVGPQQALDIGLVDELAPEGTVLQVAREEALKHWAPIPGHARHESKMRARHRLLQELESYREAETKGFEEFVTSPPIQAALQGYFDALKARKSKK